MDIETVIELSQMLFSGCHVPCTITAADNEYEYDLGLRRMIGIDPTLHLPKESAIRDNTIYCLTDIFSWKYVLLRLPQRETYMVIGPYLCEGIDDSTLMQIMEQAAVAPELLGTIREFYNRVIIVPSENMLFAFVGKLGEALWGGPDAFAVEHKSIELLSSYQPAEDGFFSAVRMENINREAIERRYQGEADLLYAIAHGKTREANAILDLFSIGTMEQRSAVPLRNHKNYMIILNTLMRKAVQHGGVHPIYIDRLSSAIAHKIERCTSIEEGYQLMRQMVRKYCLLVKNHNMAQYSQPVQSVILQVDADLMGDLSLSAHAARLGVNASYLSALFKRETGVTLTAFVNQRRVDYAIYLLNTTGMQVQTIAQYCGMPDVNYFTRTFKKLTGKTPGEYRRSVHAGQ